ncbi:PAS/PAC sensor signal transduction histidine kinase [Candidatus Magnetoovum chiemensis]|nr:PAS/PAC sensor signal transduction histidine kinase [Candidatus Magnetoovum chiemensis]
MLSEELDDTIKSIKNVLSYIDSFKKSIKDKVESNIASLLESNLILQQRVHQRTLELNQINQKLQDEINERKIIEDELRKSENRYKTLLNATTDYIYTVEVKESKAVSTIHGPGCLAVTGYTSDEYDKDSFLWYRMIHSEDRKLVIEHTANIINGYDVSSLEHRIIHKNGKIRWVKNTPVPRYDTNGKLIAYDGLITDITEIKEADMALKRYSDELEIMVKERAHELLLAKNYLESVLFSMTDALIVLNKDIVIQTVNSSVCQLLGYKESELIGSALRNFFKEESIENNVNRARKRGFVKDSFMTMITNTSENIPVLVNISRMRNTDGETILVAHDMREIRKLEEAAKKIQLKILASSKMATIGEIATGIAHEINQPLTYISSVIQGITMDLRKGSLSLDDLKNEAEVANTQIERIVKIIQHLRTFGRRDDVEMKPLRLTDILSNTMLLMGERLRLKNIKLTKRIEADLPKILGNANQLEQVFINLIQNSVDAFNSASENEHTIFIEMIRSEDMKNIIIKFSDNGIGIALDNLDKIFEPFFTTKEVGKGTGLGLSIAYGIIQDHKGIIICSSESSKGTTFTITIPALNNE